MLSRVVIIVIRIFLGICWYSLASILDNQYNFKKNVLFKFTTATLTYLGHFKTPYYMALSFNTLYGKKLKNWKQLILSMRFGKKIVNSIEKWQFVHGTVILYFKYEVPKYFKGDFVIITNVSWENSSTVLELLKFVTSKSC